MKANYSLFNKQNSLLKFFLTLICLTISTIMNLQNLIILIFLTLLYLLISYDILILWLKTILMLTPFFTSIFLFGIIFGIPFMTQFVIFLRILYVILLSVYLVSTTTIKDFLIDTNFLPRTLLFYNIRYFFSATIHFIPIFFEQYKTITPQKNDLIDSIISAIISSYKKIRIVEQATVQQLKFSNPRKFDIQSNLYLMTYIIISNLILILKVGR